MWQRRVAISVLIWLVAAVATAEALAVPTVKGVRIGQHDDKTRLVLDLTESASFKIFIMTGPDRLVIDMPPVRWDLGEQAAAFDRAGVVRVRFGQFSADTSRIVVDLTRPAVVRRTFLLEPSPGGADAYRLVVDLGSVSAAPGKTEADGQFCLGSGRGRAAGRPYRATNTISLASVGIYFRRAAAGAG